MRRLLPLGEVAREISGENELWLATALTHAASAGRLTETCCRRLLIPASAQGLCIILHCQAGHCLGAWLLDACGMPWPLALCLRCAAEDAAAMQGLASSQLAGVASALIAPESVPRGPTISAAYEPSQPVCDAIEALEADRGRLYNLQLQAEVFQPLNIDLRLSGELMHTSLPLPTVTGVPL